MMNHFLFTILLQMSIVGSRTWSLPQHQYEGSDCFAEVYNQAGICRKVSDCLSAFKSLRKQNSKITICHYDKKIEDFVMCCPNNSTEVVKSPLIGATRKHSLKLDDCVEKYFEFRRERVYTVAFVNGKEVYEGDFPNIVAIGWTQIDGSIEYNCGGSIISRNFILTAAHCTRYLREKPDVVRCGDIDLNSAEDDENVQQIKIADVIKHPDYKFSSNYHDIALIRLENDIKFSTAVAPICFWDASFEYYGVKAAGYGAIGFGDKKSNKLLQGDFYFINKTECNNVFKSAPGLPEGITNNQICARSVNQGEDEQDTCTGDSGGPIQTLKIVEEDDEEYEVPVLLGLTSFGIGCAIGAPGVYVNTTTYIDWISSALDKFED